MILSVQEPIQNEISVLLHHYPMTWCGGILILINKISVSGSLL